MPVFSLSKSIIFLLSLGLVLFTLTSAVKTFVLPRSAPEFLSRLVFFVIRRFFSFRIRKDSPYSHIDRVMAFYAPVGLLSLLPTWLGLVLLGYIGMFWSTSEMSWHDAYRMSGSSLLTLGFIPAESIIQSILVFSEATIGLILVALLIAYLPTMYAAFARRETAVGLLEVRAGSPPSAVEMLKRYHRIHGLEQLTDQWRTWESWFVDVRESHTSLSALVFFRSPQPEHSWVTASGTVLDAAALALSTLKIPQDYQAALCLRAGYISLRRIADFFNIPYDPDPQPSHAISISHVEYLQAVESLAAQGIPIQEDLDQAWKDFSGWRVNYDVVLIALAHLTHAPLALWSSDRVILQMKPLRVSRLPGSNSQ